MTYYCIIEHWTDKQKYFCVWSKNKVKSKNVVESIIYEVERYPVIRRETYFQFPFLLVSYSELLCHIERPNKNGGSILLYWKNMLSLKVRHIWKFQVRNSPPEVFLREKCSENMQEMYRGTPMPKCNFNKLLCNFMNTADYEVHNTLRTWYYICFKKFALGLFNDYFTLKLLFLDPVIVNHALSRVSTRSTLATSHLTQITSFNIYYSYLKLKKKTKIRTRPRHIHPCF